MFINFISQHKQVVVFQDDFCQCLQFLSTIDAACRITGRTEDKHLCSGGYGCLKLSRSNLEILLKTSFNNDGNTAGKLCHLGVTHPVRSGNNHFVTIVYQRHDGVADTLLGTVAHQYLIHGIVQSVLVLQLCHDSLSEFGIAGNGRIAREVVVHGLLGSFLDMIGGVKVWFTDTHVNHVDALGFHLRAFLRHGQCG